MRFHLYTNMPGIVDDNVALADLDYEQIKAFIYDLRSRKEWGKFMLTAAGDGVVDISAGEECDPIQEPPTNFEYDENEDKTALSAQAALQLRAYPDSSYSAPFKAGKKVTWVPADTIKDESGDTARVEYLPAGYYTCES